MCLLYLDVLGKTIVELVLYERVVPCWGTLDTLSEKIKLGSSQLLKSFNTSTALRRSVHMYILSCRSLDGRIVQLDVDLATSGEKRCCSFSEGLLGSSTSFHIFYSYSHRNVIS